MLEASDVREVLRYCLFTEEELSKEPEPEQIIKVKVVSVNLGFHPGRIEESRERIKEFLDELPTEFRDGWSFLMACRDNDDRQWGEHRNIDELVALGLAAGMVEWCLPRSMWEALPGGMPYFLVKT